MRKSAILALALPLAASATPIDSKEINSIFCKLNNIIVTALSKDAKATSFCSSYLSIATSTIYTTTTSTPTPTTVTTTTTTNGPTMTATTVSTSTSITTQLTTITVVSTSTATSTIFTGTTTLTCLDRAYTASPAVANTPNRARAAALEQRANKVPTPTVIPANWGAAYISPACSCLSVPTPSTTKTSTTTLAQQTVTATQKVTSTPVTTLIQVVPTTSTTTSVVGTTTSTVTITSNVLAQATTIASNGIHYRKYTSPFGVGDDAGFTADYFKTAAVDASGTNQQLSFETPFWPQDYGIFPLVLDDSQTLYDYQTAAILLQGFYIAQSTGTHTFQSLASDVDNYSYLWVGDSAYTWVDAAASFKSSRLSSGSTSGSISLQLNAGDAVPLTNLFANGGGPAQNLIRTTQPNGDDTTYEYGYFVQACSSTTFV